MSKKYEHYISNSIYEVTDDSIKSYRCGFSGSSKFPQPDVLVTTPTMNHAMELKGPIRSDTHYVEKEDLEQLVECRNGNTAAYLVVKFTYREPLIVRYFEDAMNAPEDWDELSVPEKFERVVPSAFDSTVTDSGNLRLRRPGTSDWSSSTDGREDHVVILSGLGIETEDSVVV